MYGDSGRLPEPGQAHRLGPSTTAGILVRVWKPKDAAESEAAACAGDLRETASFDAKADLPAPKKNSDVANDVAAMTTDGGVLLYGIAEDEHGQPTIAAPIPLKGAGDRVSQIVATSIKEPPHIEVHSIESPDYPGRGYLLVIVPKCYRAEVIIRRPHANSRGDGRARATIGRRL